MFNNNNSNSNNNEEKKRKNNMKFIKYFIYIIKLNRIIKIYLNLYKVFITINKTKKLS